MLRPRIGAALLGLSLSSAAGLASGCEKSTDPSQTPDASGGPEVIIEDPGQEPELVEPDEPEAVEPEGSAGPPPVAGGTEIVATQIACTSDADCVKDSCCHATSCVAPASAPNCTGTMCTMDCRAGTMDCYGGCLCQDGFCAAEIWTGPGAAP